MHYCLYLAQVSIQNCVGGHRQMTLLLYKSTSLLLQPVTLASQAAVLLMTHHLALRLRSLYLQWQEGSVVALCQKKGRHSYWDRPQE